MWALIIVAILIIFLAKLILAINTVATGFRVIAGGAIMEIDAQTFCRNVDNNRAEDIFVPTKTANEWTEFRTNYPAGVVVTDDCAVVECTSAKSCWLLYPSCEPLDLNCFANYCCYMGGSYPPPGCPPRLCPEYN